MLKIVKILAMLSLLLATLACSDPKVEVPKYIQQLSSSDSHIRSQAALALGRIGPPHAAQATSRLIALLGDENAGVRSAAAYALRKIDTPDARAALKSS